jgi:hypothetical protein
MHDWTLLNNERRGILEQVAQEWETLLSDTALLEPAYQRFLEAHAGLFFSRPTGTHIVLSKPEMGADHVPDLVVVSDNQSYGFKYELIELESPHDRAFTSKGRQSAKLTDALQQVEDWQRWLEKHVDLGRELFPSKAYMLWGDPQISYKVVIGRRADMGRNNEVRLQKSAKYNCSIRSFDHLTDQLRKNAFLDHSLFEHDQSLTDEDLNRIVSPFFCAMSSAAWKKYRTDKNFSNAHSLGFSGLGILKHRPENSALLDRFVNLSIRNLQK